MVPLGFTVLLLLLSCRDVCCGCCICICDADCLAFVKLNGEATLTFEVLTWRRLRLRIEDWLFAVEITELVLLAEASETVFRPCGVITLSD